MGIMIDDSRPAQDTPSVRAAAFSERVSELLDLSEMATAIRLVAQDVEKGLLGDSVPTTSNYTTKDSTVNDPMIEKRASDTNLIDELREYTTLTRDNLQIISEVLNTLGRELGNLGGANNAGDRTISNEENPPRATVSSEPYRG